MPASRRTQSAQLFAFAALMMFLNASLVPAIASAEAEEQRTSDLGVYSPGGWSTLHRGPANRKLVQGVKLAESYSSWTALAGASKQTSPILLTALAGASKQTNPNLLTALAGASKQTSPIL